MVYVTGDTHGDFSRFQNSMLKKADANDIVIVCGDFGFFWNDSKQEQKFRKKLSELKYTVAFVDGCHENYDMLEKFPVKEWNGGQARVIAPNLVHLLRGEIYTICGKRFFTFGGGHSQDFEYRTAENWWEQEQPTYDEIIHAAENLKSYDNTVDYIITHEPPASLKDCLRVDTMQRLEVHAFFEDLTQMCNFHQWYFGKCHLNRYVPLKYYAVFDEIHPLNNTIGKAITAQYEPSVPESFMPDEPEETEEEA